MKSNFTNNAFGNDMILLNDNEMSIIIGGGYERTDSFTDFSGNDLDKLSKDYPSNEIAY